MIIESLKRALLSVAACGVLVGAPGVARAACFQTEPKASADDLVHLALVVGVNDYKLNDDAPSDLKDLRGPKYDAERFAELIKDKSGFAFPEQNVCVLLEQGASYQGFLKAFDDLKARAPRGAQVVIYFAGHGMDLPKPAESQDEEARWQAIVLQDSLSIDQHGKVVPTLLDKKFKVMLADLRKGGVDVTVVLDSCHSGGSTRDIPDPAADAAPRFAGHVEDLLHGKPYPYGDLPTGGEDGNGFVFEDRRSADLPGVRGAISDSQAGSGSLVVLAAAAADELSWEERLDSDPQEIRPGVFTRALLAALAGARNPALTYRDIEAEVINSVKATGKPQVPQFFAPIENDLKRVIFGATYHTRPTSWEVVSRAGNTVNIRGVPLPGVGQGAVFTIYDKLAQPSQLNDPRFMKAEAEVQSVSGTNAVAKLFNIVAGKTINSGDFALLTLVKSEDLKLAVRILEQPAPRGLPQTLARKLRTEIQTNDEAKISVVVKDANDARADFEIRMAQEGRIAIIDSEGNPRVSFKESETRMSDITQTLWWFARQSALLRLKGQGGGDLPAQSLQVTVEAAPIPAEFGTANCNKEFKVPPAVKNEPNGRQRVPLCAGYVVKVQRKDNYDGDISVGAVILTNSGEIQCFDSADGGPYRKGESRILGPAEPKFHIKQAIPPLSSEDSLMVFGTGSDNAIKWSDLCAEAKTRAVDLSNSRPSLLRRQLDAYLSPGKTRGSGGMVPSDEKPSPWTVTSVPIEIYANPECVGEDGGLNGCERNQAALGNQPETREYTIPKFEIAPYLPDDTSSALFRVLTAAHKLYLSHGPGAHVQYKQHNQWPPASDTSRDEDLLKKGIDCSRSIWYAFTRTEGISYNRRSNAYLATADMVTSNSAMNDEFGRCDAPYRTGDLLVYRNETKRVGHVVMVIDPVKRIAWGSHGWDGNVNLNGTSMTGVQYQLIKFKQDWLHWDKLDMNLVRCWRYKQFDEDWKSGNTRTALAAIAQAACHTPEKCGMRLQDTMSLRPRPSVFEMLPVPNP